MATVELHVDNELLDVFEGIRPKLNGLEVGRHPSPVEGVTVLDMDMADAPPHAKTMEVVVSVASGQPDVIEIHYWDERGIFIAPEVPFPRP
ncbi:hypothetical protein [Streptomyces sp. NBC_01614]|uniref:hypothetical protein n=1 Tax=Streptomyces sp. NBC_01614 TaxID=2975897 RepID=UPI00386B1C82